MDNNTEIVRVAPRAPSARIGVSELIKAFLSGRNKRTIDAYAKDLRDFAGFAGFRTPVEALAWFLDLDVGNANLEGMNYKADMVDRNLKSATIARRLAALRSVVKVAKTLGIVTWTLAVENPRVQAYRDTKGPGAEGWQAMLQFATEAAATGRKRGLRNLAVIRLLHDLGLRRGELAALRLADVELTQGAAWVEVIGKGQTQSIRLTLPEPTREALVHWVGRRGRRPGPLFQRLTDSGVYQVVHGLSLKAGLPRATRPHGLRHEAITRALELTNGNIRMVQKFSRHADPKTVLRYDDARTDLAGDVAKLVAENRQDNHEPGNPVHPTF